MSKRHLGFWDKFWNDKNGNPVIIQPLNIWIIIWFVATIISHIVSEPIISNMFSWIGFGALLVWALLEIFYGVNHFRKTLGTVIFLVSILWRLNL